MIKNHRVGRSPHRPWIRHWVYRLPRQRQQFIHWVHSTLMETVAWLINCPSKTCQPAQNTWRFTAHLFPPLSMWRQSLNLSLDDLFQLSKISPPLVCNPNSASRLARPSLHVSSSVNTPVFLCLGEISPNSYFACLRTKHNFANGAFVINFAVRILQERLVTSMPVFPKLSFNNVSWTEKLA